MGIHFGGCSTLSAFLIPGLAPSAPPSHELCVDVHEKCPNSQVGDVDGLCFGSVLNIYTQRGQE